MYTYQNSFYHGKFYYIANDNKAFVIIGSSNISKTAYLNNYELDLLFEIDCNNPEEQDFINWFEKFKSECVKIEELNAEEYDALDWDSELDIYEDTFVYVARKVCVYSVWDFIYYYNVLGVKG